MLVVVLGQDTQARAEVEFTLQRCRPGELKTGILANAARLENVPQS
jgi:hypothetical protein